MEALSILPGKITKKRYQSKIYYYNQDYYYYIQGDGEYILANKSIIKGKFLGDELREGSCIFSNGDIYQGPFKKFKLETNALKKEIGTLTGKNYLYRGEFKNGKRHGRGRIDYADGAYYEGEYKDDLKHGQGVFEMKGYVIHVRIYLHLSFVVSEDFLFNHHLSTETDKSLATFGPNILTQTKHLSNIIIFNALLFFTK